MTTDDNENILQGIAMARDVNILDQSTNKLKSHVERRSSSIFSMTPNTFHERAKESIMKTEAAAT